MLCDNVLHGAYMTHNHPATQSRYSFSEFDIAEFFKHRFSMLRGVDERYVYEIKIAPKTLSESYDKTRSMFSDVFYKEVLDKIYL